MKSYGWKNYSWEEVVVVVVLFYNDVGLCIETCLRHVLVLRAETFKMASS